MSLNMLGDHLYKGRDGKTYKIPEWKNQGFLHCPKLYPATGMEHLFRVWSNPDRKKGSFFSLVAYRSRREAELHSNVMQYGNGVLHQTRFTVAKGTPMWVGSVHPGDHPDKLGTAAGTQVYIDKEFLGNVFEDRDLPILDDMNGAHVIDNPDRGQLNS
jgi:hypothetical protein